MQKIVINQKMRKKILIIKKQNKFFDKKIEMIKKNLIIMIT